LRGRENIFPASQSRHSYAAKRLRSESKERKFVTVRVTNFVALTRSDCARECGGWRKSLRQNARAGDKRRKKAL
jgi:hypothetical protein